MRTSQERRIRRTFRKWLGKSRLVTVLLEDAWFRLILLISFLGVVVSLVLTSPIWITTPKGLSPTRRISALDMIIAHRLHDRAKAEATAGEINTAANTWHMARQRNPGNLAMLRESTLNFLAMGDSLFENRAEALALAAWLVGVSQTNHADVVLAARVYETYKAPEQILAITEPKLLRESEDLAAPRFVALIRLGRLSQLREELAALPAPVKKRRDTQLFEDALSLFSKRSDAPVSRERLKAASRDPEQSALAMRLLFRGSVAMEDLNTAMESLRHLVETKRNELQDHLLLWRLASKLGASLESLNIVDENVPNPLTATEAFQLISTLANLNRVELASQALRRELPKHPKSIELWMIQAEVLARTKEWHPLIAAALQLREQFAESRDATALSHLMELQGFTELKMPAEAQSSLYHLKQIPLGNTSLALYMAQVLRQLGAYATIEQVLKPFQADLDRNPEFWSLLFDAGFATKSTELVLEASNRALELEPDRPEAINRRAVALIVARESPQEALRLTERLKSLYPGFPGATINLVQALLLNARHEEAARLLNGIEPRALSTAESNPFWLAAAELALLQNEPQKWGQYLGRIRVDDLFPKQARWLDEARRRSDH